MSRKVIAIMGATGAQGGGLARAIAADQNGPFFARAVTRHPDSEKARALAALGVEVVAGDPSPSLGTDAAALLERLRDGALTADEIVRRSSIEPAAASAALMELELAGAVALEDGVYRASV